MRSSDTVLRAVGQQIRARRVEADLTQEALGNKAGIVGKYVSEIERGTRDMPISTLFALVEHGLGLKLDIAFNTRNGSRPDVRLPPIPAAVEEVARLVAALPAEHRARVLEIVRTIVELVEQ
jgi:transcriptional regulator with XRE-family HTH domain